MKVTLKMMATGLKSKTLPKTLRSKVRVISETRLPKRRMRSGPESIKMLSTRSPNPWELIHQTCFKRVKQYPL